MFFTISMSTVWLASIHHKERNRNVERLVKCNHVQLKFISCPVLQSEFTSGTFSSSISGQIWNVAFSQTLAANMDVTNDLCKTEFHIPSLTGYCGQVQLKVPVTFWLFTLVLRLINWTLNEVNEEQEKETTGKIAWKQNKATVRLHSPEQEIFKWTRNSNILLLLSHKLSLDSGFLLQFNWTSRKLWVVTKNQLGSRCTKVLEGTNKMNLNEGEINRQINAVRVKSGGTTQTTSSVNEVGTTKNWNKRLAFENEFNSLTVKVSHVALSLQFTTFQTTASTDKPCVRWKPTMFKFRNTNTPKLTTLTH